jgi:hypothetical protein
VATFGLLRLVPGARLMRWTGSLAWQLATFFVLPVIAFEGGGTSATLRRSAGLTRDQARRTVAPAAGMLLACVPAFVPGLMLLYLAYMLPFFSQPAGLPFPPPDGTLLTLAMIALVPAAGLVGTSSLLLRYALYQRATGGEAPAVYARADLEAALPSQ